MRDKYQHVFWDWNGTLLDDAWLCVDVLNHLLARRNLPLITLKNYIETFSFPAIDYYRRLGFDTLKDSFESLSLEYINIYNLRRQECALHTGVLEIVDTFMKQNIHQSILSAYRKDYLIDALEIFKLKEYFLHISGLDNIYANSKLENGIRLLKNVEENPEHILMIGDTQHDYEVACGMGIDCILLAHGHNHYEILQRCGCKVFKTMDYLKKFLGI